MVPAEGTCIFVSFMYFCCSFSLVLFVPWCVSEDWRRGRIFSAICDLSRVRWGDIYVVSPVLLKGSAWGLMLINE